MMIPREVIEEIKYRCDIEEVISSYVQLKRSGSNFVGLCPFHSEKSPSFTVFKATGGFYCFGCGAGGDVISFIMRAENLDYPSAVEFLAKRAGIKIPESAETVVTGVKRTRIYDMNRAAARFFRDCLFDPKIGGAALDYLTNKRSLSGAVIKRFGLGYSPDAFGMLLDHMKSLGYTEEELTVGFLCGRSRKTGRPYDYFRNRVMFPIIDVTGNVIAFGGRVMDDSKPKYLNSSDTPGFKKSRSLFALNFAKSECAEKLILCEGYMDVIALHAAGFSNSVATLGTALTGEQARIMAKYTKKVIITYDSDEPGQKAAARAIQIFGDVGLEVAVLKVKDAKDPDEFIKKYGAVEFQKMIDGSKSSFDYKLDGVLTKYDIEKGEDKIAALGELTQMIASSSSAIEREVYIAAVSKKLDFPADVLRSSVEKEVKKQIYARRQNERKEAYTSTVGFGDRVNPDTVKDLRVSKTEEVVLGLLLIYPEHRRSVAEGRIKLCEDDFFTEFGRRVYTEIMALENGGGFEFGMLGEKFTPDEMGRLAKIRLEREALSDNGALVFAKAAETLEDEREKRGHRDGKDISADIAWLIQNKKTKRDNNT